MHRSTKPTARYATASLLVVFVLSLLAAIATPSGAQAQTAATPKMVGYFTQWGIFERDYQVKDILTSGAAERLTHINYAFSNVVPDVQGGQVRCKLDDPWADYQKTWTAAESVDGVAVPWGGALRGNMQQLKALKDLIHARNVAANNGRPDLKIMISLGGWTLSRHFSDMARTAASRTAFVQSCINLFIKGNLPVDQDAGGTGAAAGVFDGIDIDWEFPGVCGEACEGDYALPYTCGDAPVRPITNSHSGPLPTCIARPTGTNNDKLNFTKLLQEFRRQLNIAETQDGKEYLLTAATSANVEHVAYLERNKIHQYLDFINLMAYDLHGGWDATTNFQSALYPSPSDPAIAKRLTVSEAVTAYLGGPTPRIPRAKLVIGVPFYGRGWRGVANTNNGLYQAATGPAPATWTINNPQAGIEDYKVLKARRLADEFVRYFNSTTKTAWLYDAEFQEFWTYDDVTTVKYKAQYVKTQALGGVMFWELSGDTADAELVKALYRTVR